MYIRRKFFAKRFDHIVASALVRKAARADGEVDPPRNRLATLARASTRRDAQSAELEHEKHNGIEKKKPFWKSFRTAGLQQLRPDMIRRVDDTPKLIDPSGWVSHSPLSASQRTSQNLPQATSSWESEPPTSAETSLKPDHHEE